MLARANHKMSIPRFVRGLAAAKVLRRYRPLLVNIEPTHRCNLACTFCDKASSRATDMDTQQGLRLIDELADAGTCSVCFDGGEPLLHPGIGDFVARARGHRMRVALSTNGILIPKRLDVVANVDVVKVSLDGNEQQHDQGRGAGAYRRALAGVRAARERGISIILRMTVGAHNLDGWQSVLEEATRLGCKAIFQPATGSIMDQAAPPGSHSAAAQPYREVIDALMAAQRAGAPVANNKVCLQHLRWWPEPREVSFCAGGRIQAAISPEGWIYPCGRWGRHRAAPNAFTSGVKTAFAALAKPEAKECGNCWCTLTLASCFLWRLDPRLMQDLSIGATQRRAPGCIGSPAPRPLL